MSSPEQHQQQPNAALQWAQQHPMPPQRVSQLTGATNSQQQTSSQEYYRQMMVAQGKLPAEQHRPSVPAPNIERPNSQPQQQQRVSIPLPPPNIINMIGSEQSRPSQQFVMAQERIPVDVMMRQPSVSVQRMSQQLPPPPAGYVFLSIFPQCVSADDNET